jgi:hypothetical protein
VGPVVVAEAAGERGVQEGPQPAELGGGEIRGRGRSQPDVGGRHGSSLVVRMPEGESG